MRIRSRGTAPPLNGLDGSIATTATEVSLHNSRRARNESRLQRCGPGATTCARPSVTPTCRALIRPAGFVFDRVIASGSWTVASRCVATIPLRRLYQRRGWPKPSHGAAQRNLAVRRAGAGCVTMLAITFPLPCAQSARSSKCFALRHSIVALNAIRRAICESIATRCG